MARGLKTIIGIVCAILIGLGAKIAYDKYNENYTVKADDAGFAVARVVAAKLYGESNLRVSRLRGTVQGVAVDARFFDLLQSQRVMKAPFQVGYFVDLSKLRPADFRYDVERKTLLVDAPPIRIEAPDIDESRISLDRTNGWFVTREAMIVLQRRASISAMGVAAEAARKPENIALAKTNARRAIAALFGGSLRAAGLEATVKVRFADEARDTSEVWDATKSIAEVLGNAT